MDGLIEKVSLSIKRWYVRQGGEEDETRRTPDYGYFLGCCCRALLYRTAGSIYSFVCDRNGDSDPAVSARQIISGARRPH